MQKIITQDLGGSEETAKEKAQYTWQKDEIAWYFNLSYKDVFKVKFTGERWIIGNAWSRRKIYQYQYLATSGDHDLKRMGLDNNGISHGEEEEFFTTKDEAVAKGFKYLQREKDYFMREYEKNMLKLMSYNTKTEE